MEVIIKKLVNGYIVIVEGGTDYVIEEKQLLDLDKREAEIECFVRLLTNVAESLGYTYDGFSKNNLKITGDLVGDEL